MTAGRARWTIEEAQAWYAHQPWLVGCNFIPSTAVNQLEMWQAETFDAETIERELRWAAEIGFNTARVFLHDLLWQQDERGFAERVDLFLTIAERFGIRPMFVLFDGVWYPKPKLGPQRAARDRIHNSGWVQSPGAEILSDPARHDELRGYVRGIIERFQDDARVLAWDLFNEPAAPNLAYARHEPADKPRLATALLGKAFHWAREAQPHQPLTAGLWSGPWTANNPLSEINALMVAESDVISFHSYEPPEKVRTLIDELDKEGRPLLITEYLARTFGSTFQAVLPLFKERNVAAYNWGFVSGKTQTIYPWDSWTKTYTGEPDPWFHDILHPDGTPYDSEETRLIRALTRRG